MPKFQTIILACMALALECAAFPSDWRQEQRFTLASPGLVKSNLPADTLNGARSALEDLRLFDDSGNELPYAIERPTPVIRPLENPRAWHVSFESAVTVITVQTGLTQPIDSISLQTPAADFLKAVDVEGSDDGKNWTALVQHQPIFRTATKAEQLRVSFPSGLWAWLRVTVDDQRSTPIPFVGVRFESSIIEQAPVESQPAAIIERNENPGETSLTIDLGAANLDVASVEIETDEPLFTRAITLLEPQVTEASIREKPIGHGVIYRVALEGQDASAKLSVPLGTRVTSRQLTVLIRNEDSPPLQVSAIRIERRPVYMIFMAKTPGVFHLLTGNKLCASPRYDLAELGSQFKALPVTAAAISSLADNPDYRAPETLRGLEIAGAPLDVANWRFRKPIRLARNGAQQMELDLDVLSRAASDFADVRIVSGTNQVPYIIEHTLITRSAPLTATASNDVKTPNRSCWAIRLPRPALPFWLLTCDSATPLFQRQMLLYEEVPGERGETYRVTLANADWTQTPERKNKHFVLTLNHAPRGDLLLLQTENGDNPSIQLGNFTASYSATRVLFKASAADRLFLYYGNARATTPSYDLSLVADDLLAADKSAATLDAEQQLKKASGTERPIEAAGGVLFWIALTAVVVGLLAVIGRLLPKTP